MARKAYEETNIAAIAERIRANTGGTSTYKTAEMAGGVDEVYTAGYTAKDGEIAEQTDRLNARMQGDTSETMRDEVYNEGKADGITEGRKAEYDAFWDVYQNYGKPKSYLCTFAGSGWKKDTFKPKYSIKPGAETAYMMFRYTRVEGDLVEYMAERGLEIDLAGVGSRQYTFSHCYYITRVGVVDVADSSNCNELFASSNALVTIDKLILSENNKFYNLFYQCTALENVIVEGVIGQNGFSVIHSTKLTHDSLMSIINALKDYSADTSGTTWTVTLGSTNMAKLTEEELQIAYDKGWNVA